MKIDYKNIFLRTKQMLIRPAAAWSEVLQENLPAGYTFRNYLFPLSVWVAVIVFLLSLIYCKPLKAAGLGAINLISTAGGAWIAYLIIREYLCSKLDCRDYEALNLTVYSYAVFIIFRSIGTALGTAFVGQIFTLLSLVFFRTLYAGIGQLPDLPAGQKTNVIIITSMVIICIPVIITHLLMIVFRISAITV